MKIALSIDGGGIRGAIAARLLELLEKELNTPLYNIFDFFAGSSTGSLIVCAIAYCKLPADYISNNLYCSETASKIMHKTWTDKILGIFQTRPKYDGIDKRKEIQKFAKEKFFSDTEKNVIVPVYDVTDSKSIIFKSWEEKNTKLLDVLDTASAAPGFFPSVEYLPGKWGVDSGIVSNNPSLYCYTEMLKMYGPEEKIKILSLGTGTKETKMSDTQQWGGIPWISRGNIIDLIMSNSIDNTDNQLKILTEQFSHEYLRINAELKNTDTDDTSSENIEILKEEADKIWSTNRKKIIKFVTEL